jgi:hypothetical protein
MENNQMPLRDLIAARTFSDIQNRLPKDTTALGGIRQPVTGPKKGWWPRSNTLCWEGAYHLDSKVGLWRYYSVRDTTASHTDIHFNL